MSDGRAEGRRKKAERRKRRLVKKARRAHARQRIREERAEYPDFVYDDAEGTPEFVALVKDAIRQFDFRELPQPEQDTFKLMKEDGAEMAMRYLKEAMARVREEKPDNAYAKMGDIWWQTNLGEVVLGKIPRTVLERFMPMDDVGFIPVSRKILVQFRSLMRFRSSGGTTYYSRRQPTIEFNNRKHIVGFSKEAIKRLCERIIPCPGAYAPMFEVHAYMEDCQYFEPCTLRDGGEAFTFFNLCDTDERLWESRYVREVLGVRNLDPQKGRPYYRVGYCPVVFDGDFAKARTLLFPGFAKTPECQALEKSDLSPQEKRRIRSIATNGSAASYLWETNDFSAIKWFHENGVLQVIQTDRPLFAPYEVRGSRGSPAQPRSPGSDRPQ